MWTRLEPQVPVSFFILKFSNYCVWPTIATIHGNLSHDDASGPRPPIERGLRPRYFFFWEGFILLLYSCIFFKLYLFVWQSRMIGQGRVMAAGAWCVSSPSSVYIILRCSSFVQNPVKQKSWFIEFSFILLMCHNWEKLNRVLTFFDRYMDNSGICHNWEKLNGVWTFS